MEDLCTFIEVGSGELFALQGGRAKPLDIRKLKLSANQNTIVVNRIPLPESTYLYFLQDLMKRQTLEPSQLNETVYIPKEDLLIMLLGLASPPEFGRDNCG